MSSSPGRRPALPGPATEVQPAGLADTGWSDAESSAATGRSRPAWSSTRWIRAAAAVATEQEMTARVSEMRARVVEAEAQIPMAMAEAFRSGNLGVMDYYKLRNVQADTNMRDNIAGGDKDGSQT